MSLDEVLSNFFAKSSDPVLFAGAGVSAKAGVITWGSLLDRLKEWIRSRDPLTTHQMSDLIHQGDFLAAADYFFMSKKVTDGDRFDALVSHLDKFEPKQLKSLTALPFKGMVTTNFDRCLLDAYAATYGKSVRDFRRGDQSFKEVLWCQNDYVARIHGGVESPSSIVLASKHFEMLDNDDVYQDVLTNLFTRKNILFLGCSFTDPAVKSVFETINRAYGAAPAGRHIAFIPNNSDNDFTVRLGRMNVEIVRYDPKNNHEELWGAIDRFSSNTQVLNSSDMVDNEQSLPIPFAAAKNYLASCYARVRLSGRIHPLRLSVVEGIVSSIIQEHSPKGVLFTAIVDQVHRDLGLSRAESEQLAAEAINQLTEEKLCRRHNDGGIKKISWIGEKTDQNSLGDAIEELSVHILDRAVVQEGLRPVSDAKKAIAKFLTNLVLMRGWDLGAAYASNKPPVDVDIDKLLYQACTFLSHPEIEKLKRVCVAMLTTPTDAEATILAELGRASFALELAIQSPRNALFHSTVLPQRIYLDANVLMPALTFGHPFYEVYRDTIERLKDAVSKSGGTVQIFAYHGFLNEMVSHRKLAIHSFEEWGDVFLDGVTKEALYYGTSNMNVFVGAYASIAATNGSMEFPEFLTKYAPYSNEKELAHWLKRQGILVESDSSMRTTEYSAISLELQKAYSTQLAAGKDMRLIEHDAVQLCRLYADQQRGIRSIFVSADKRLREMVAKGKYATLVEHMISNVGMSQLIDLLVGSGNSSSSRAISKLIWSTSGSSKADEVRQYLVKIALDEYDEALAMEMPKVLDQISEDIIFDLERSGVSGNTDDPSGRRKYLKAIEGYEDKFFQAIRERIDARENAGRK